MTESDLALLLREHLDALKEERVATAREREAQAAERRELLHAIGVLSITLHVEKLRKKFLDGDFSLLKDPDRLLSNLEGEEDGH